MPHAKLFPANPPNNNHFQKPVLKMGQAELAERMETTQSVVARLESGRIHPSTRTLEKIARATGTRLRISFDPA